MEKPLKKHGPWPIRILRLLTLRGCIIEKILPVSNFKVAIMASGSGSNAENLLSYAAESGLFTVERVITDQPGAGVISRCEKFEVDCFVVPFIKEDESEPFSKVKARQELKVMAILNERKVEWVFLAGYMRILSSKFIKQFSLIDKEKSKIVNIHPALLPQFPGIDAYEQAWKAGVLESGVTVHHVDEGIDTGSIIAQERFIRSETDDFTSFKKRGMNLEYKLYKKAVEKLFQDSPYE
ncbi:MAG: phosphoribosylglycinamide formyltransferase-1 [Bacteriovoracaceae bacterium]